MDTKEVKNAEKSTKRKKGLLKKLINFKSVIIISIILAVISVYQLLVHERFSFTINTLSSYSVNADVEFDVIVNDLKDNSNFNYYNSKESLYDKIVDKLTNDNVTLSAVLLDEDGKKVKGTSEKVKAVLDEKKNVEISLPDDMEEGTYTLSLKARKGIFSDKAEKDLNFKVSSNDIITISMDKGIYKPGDEVKFRALITNSKNDTPVQADVEVSIYDGNDNRVFYENTKTSEFGIISGIFNLGKEVNSGDYTLKVKLDNTEKTCVFNVEAYTEERFKVAVENKNEIYKTTEKIEFDVAVNYFFGEPVVDAAVVIKNIDTDKTKTLRTNSEGVAKYISTFEEEGTYNYSISVTDTSNYFVEKTEQVVVSDSSLKIDIVPEYSSIIKGIKNRIYVYTNDLNGNPVKTVATLYTGKITREFTTDENGIGFVDIASNDFESGSTQYIEVNVKDENGNASKVSKTFDHITSTNIIKTDKVLYSQGENIEISLQNFSGDKENIYFVKNGELITTYEIDSNEKKISLENTYGLIDIYCPGVIERSSVKYDTGYTSSWNGSYNYSDNIRLNKRTIFIKPTMDYMISLSTDEEEYKPSDDMTLKISSNKDEASAYLVSIIDTANLNMADNDLNIDKVKLALQDVRLSEGIDAAELYATIMSSSNEVELEKLLVKQYSNDFNITKETLRSNFDDELFENILNYSLLVLVVSIVILVIYFNAKGIDNKAFNFLSKTVVNVVLLSIVLFPLVYEFFDISSEVSSFILSIIFSSILYAKFIKQYEEKISKAVYEIATLGVTAIGLNYAAYELGTQLVAIIGLVFAIIVYSNRQKNWAKIIIDVVKIIVKSYVMVFLSVIAYSIIMEVIDINYDFEILIYALVLVGLYSALYKYRDERSKVRESEKKQEDTKHKDIFNYIGVGVVVLIVLSSLGILNITRNFSSNISGSIYTPDLSVSQNSFVTGTYSGDVITDSSMSLDSLGSKADSFIESGTSSFDGFDFNFGSNKDESAVQEDSVVMESEPVVEESIDTEIVQKVRNVFLECLAFIPEVVAESGNTDVDIKLSDNITTWKVQVVGNTKNGDIGYSDTDFRVFKEFFVDFTVPNNLKVGDKIQIPVTIYNYTEGSLNVSLNIENSDWFKLNSNNNINKSVAANNSELVYINLEILKAGDNKLKVAASANGLNDIIEKTVPVNFKGLEINKVSSNGNTKEDFAGEILFTEDYIEGSNTATVNIYSNYLAFAIEGMDSILKMPNGCFEQVSSSLYPDIMVLSYLETSGSDDKELKEKAIEYINTGYQKILTYEVPGERGGFSLYGRPKAETVLTAYGLMELNDLNKVYKIDEDVLKRMEEFLTSKQEADGSFEITGYTSVINSYQEVTQNAYITWALSEYNPKSDVVKKGIEYLLEEADDVEDNYTLGLIVNALINVNDPHKNKYLDELLENIEEDDKGNKYLTTSRNDYMGTRYGMNVQTTAMASMALSKLDKENSLNQSFINYIISQRGTKSWNNTQTTVLALRAINLYNSENKAKDQTIKVRVGDQEKEVELKKNGVDYIRLDFNNLDKNETFEISGIKSNIYFEVIKNYYIDYKNIKDESSFKVDRTFTNTTLKVNDVLTEEINILNTTGKNIDNIMVEVEIPQGFILLNESLEQLVVNDVIEKYESNYGKVMLYVRDLGVNKSIDLDIDFRALYPVEITGGAVKVYDYYNQETSENIAPEKLIVND